MRHSGRPLVLAVQTVAGRLTLQMPPARQHSLAAGAPSRRTRHTTLRRIAAQGSEPARATALLTCKCGTRWCLLGEMSHALVMAAGLQAELVPAAELLAELVPAAELLAELVPAAELPKLMIRPAGISPRMLAPRMLPR